MSRGHYGRPAMQVAGGQVLAQRECKPTPEPHSQKCRKPRAERQTPWVPMVPSVPLGPWGWGFMGGPWGALGSQGSTPCRDDMGASRVW